MKHLMGRVTAITGAGSGIGRALAVECAKRGSHLALSDINEAGLAETLEMAQGHGVKVTHQRLDVSDREAVYAWADQVVADHGQVNLIINNAGVGLADTIENMKYEDFEWLMGINFWGVVYGTKAFLPHLIDSGEGHIVNISSVFGFIGVPTQSAYNASKFAVRGFTEALLEELDVADYNVTASCVHPGGIRTNIARSTRMNADLEMLSDRDKVVANFDKVARTTPEQAAKTIIAGVLKRKRRILIGKDAYAIDSMARLLPTGYQHILARTFGRKAIPKKDP